MINSVELEGLEDKNYLNDIINKLSGILLSKAKDIALDYIEHSVSNLIRNTPEYVNKKVKEQTIVTDVSISKNHTILSSGGVEIDFIVVGGLSDTYNIGGNENKNGIYPHIGIGFSVGAGSMDNLDIPSISFSGGIVGGKYDEAIDYSGAFADFSGNVSGFGASYCYWPEGANASSLTLDAKALGETIFTEKPNASASVRVDWYFMIPEDGKPETSISNQWGRFSKFLKDMFNGDEEGFNQVMKDVEEVFIQLKEKALDNDKE